MAQARLSSVLSKWSLDHEEQTILDKYFILYWETRHFQSLSRIGTITRQDIDYHIIYHQCLPNALDNHPYVALSFRRINSMTYGYVLVKGVDHMPDSKGIRN
jgi:hypothetical protein